MEKQKQNSIKYKSTISTGKQIAHKLKFLSTNKNKTTTRTTYSSPDYSDRIWKGNGKKITITTYKHNHITTKYNDIYIYFII
jgi:hypothetical protein